MSRPSPDTRPDHRRDMLVGREREQEMLRQALEQMLSGNGGLVLVSGEAGIGKTALVEDLSVDAEEAGALVLWGHAYDFSVTPPYGPWLGIFRQYRSLDAGPPPIPAFVGNAEDLAKVGSQESLFVAVAEFFVAVAVQRPLMLVLDDLHWADQASLDFFRFFARQIDTQRILLVAIYRSDELHRRHPLYNLLPLLVREAGAERLEVRALDAKGHQALIQSRYALVQSDEERLERYLADHAEGNPLYAGELLRTLEDAGVLRQEDGVWVLGDLEQVRVPTLLRQVIERRLARLQEDTRQLLQLAAVIGQDVPLELWQQVSGASDEAVITAVEQGQSEQLLEEASDARYRFRHALFREALYEEVIALRRRIWHRQIAEVRAQLPNPNPDQVAYHFQQAGDARAVEWLLKAGERAERAYAWVTAAERFEAALAKLDEHGMPALERALLLFRIARLNRYRNPGQSVKLLNEACGLALEAGEQGLASRCLVQSGLYRCFAGDVRQGLAVMERASDELHDLAADDLARLRNLLGRDADAGEGALPLWLAIVGRSEEAIARGERLLAETSLPTMWLHHADALSGLAYARVCRGTPLAARDAIHRGLSIYQQIGHHYLVAILYRLELEGIQLPYFPEDLESRRRLATAGELAMQRAIGALPAAIAPHYVALPLLLLEGNWAGAARSNWPTVAAGQAITARQASDVRWLALLAREQGDIELAWRFIGEILPDGPTTEPGNAYFPGALAMQRLAARMALDANDVPAARTWLEAHDRWLEWSGAVLGLAEGAAGWAQYHHANGDPVLARASAEQALSHASDPRQPLALIAVHRFLGQLDTEEQRFVEAEVHLQESLQLAEACAAPFERALTLLVMAELASQTEDVDLARRLLARVRHICQPLGAKPTLERADQIEAGLPKRRPSHEEYPAGLTAREVEVLRLVAEGMTDAEVAEELFISPRTVGQHLRSVYNKIGIGSRAAASRFAAENHLI